jgi:hypothetical protein
MSSKEKGVHETNIIILFSSCGVAVAPCAPLHPYISSTRIEDLGQKIRRAASARLLPPQADDTLSAFLHIPCMGTWALGNRWSPCEVAYDHVPNQ